MGDEGKRKRERKKRDNENGDLGEDQSLFVLR